MVPRRASSADDAAPRTPAEGVPEGGLPADHRDPAANVALNATKAVGRGIGRAGAATGRATARGARFATTKFRTYTHSGGAGDSGLAKVAEMHASHAAGDAAMMLALAGTIFFNPQVEQARSQVAMFLLITMVPFVLVAPLIGPLLDRIGHGRRWAIGTTLAGRAFLCWVLGEAISTRSDWLYPAALGCLVASQAYNITRAAAVPRLLPQGTTLVNANSKVAVAGVVGAVLGGALAGAVLALGAAWSLRVAFVIFIVGTVQAIRLPERVDSAVGEERLDDTAPIPVRRADIDEHEPDTIDANGMGTRFTARMRGVPWPVKHALWSSGATRLLTGFLIFYMAFLAREHPIDGRSITFILAVASVSVGIGNALGSALGNVLRGQRPEAMAMIAVLVTLVTTASTGIWYGVWTLALLGVVQGMSGQVTKLCFDALVQREVPESARASVFAWSETIRQVLWVIGGGLGILLPLIPWVGFSAAAIAMLGCIVLAARTRLAAAHTGSSSRRAR